MTALVVRLITALDSVAPSAKPAETPGLLAVASRNPAPTGLRRGLRGTMDAAPSGSPSLSPVPAWNVSMFTRTMFGLMLFGAVLAWDRFSAAAPHKAPPAVLAKPHTLEPAPVWDIVIGQGYIRGRTVMTPDRTDAGQALAQSGIAAVLKSR
jgi:hypothetical protein